MVRDPGAHLGESYRLFGKITQFDSATGTNTFRASIGYDKKWPASYGYVDYDANAIFLGVSTDLEDVVQDDVVELWVTCMGSTTYQTAIGGSQTVPYSLVGKVKRYATAS
ncbi:hypothetical protein OG851_03110 [Streptomyces sp. NBC_00161]|uniref:hypothetical protein n=1 Tax=Streptomyces sp. NBC_00161 TaxID=2975671 RepID=UPI0032487E48